MVSSADNNLKVIGILGGYKRSEKNKINGGLKNLKFLNKYFFKQG